MDELEKNTPDAFWRKAFEDAAETPPARVWNAIERELDKSEDSKIIPLWGKGLSTSRPLVWSMGIAAAIILVLAGWWLTNAPVKTEINQRQLSKIERKDTKLIALPKPAPVAEQPEVAASVASPNLITNHSRLHAGNPLHTVNARAIDLIASAKTGKKLRTVDVATTQPTTSAVQVAGATPQRNTLGSTSYAVSRITSAAYTQPMRTGLVSFEKYASLPMQLGGARPIQRIVWARPLELSAEPASTKSKRTHKELWASVGILSATYNPMVSVRSVYANSYSSLTSNNASAVTSQPNFSVAYQASAGIQLSDRWSVESGVGYLSAHSTVDSPVQLTLNPIQSISNKDLTSNNVYIDALKNSSQLVRSVAAISNSNSYLASNTSSQQQGISNNYQYVQVPVQIGYQLRPRKRFGLALLGGIFTNIFVKNTVADEVIITAKDGIYRPLSFAAIMGARVRYRPSRQWSASVAGIYQSTLGLGTQTDSQVQIHPTAAGMSFGVDYHF